VAVPDAGCQDQLGLPELGKALKRPRAVPRVCPAWPAVELPLPSHLVADALVSELGQRMQEDDVTGSKFIESEERSTCCAGQGVSEVVSGNRHRLTFAWPVR